MQNADDVEVKPQPSIKYGQLGILYTSIFNKNHRTSTDYIINDLWISCDEKLSIIAMIIDKIHVREIDFNACAL